MRRVAGFTLLEVLVAMSIFAVIGLGATQMLRTMIQTHERIQHKVTSFNGVTQAFSRLERDLGQIVNRPIRDEYGDYRPALTVATGDYPLEFTRAGWRNPAQRPRSNLQRVAYELSSEGQLLRHFWLVLDRAEDSTIKTQVLLGGITDWRVNLIGENGETTDSWPVDAAAGSLPAGIEMIVETKALGTLRRLYPLVSVVIVPPVGGSPGGDEVVDDDESEQGVDDESEQDDDNADVQRGVELPGPDS
ncbi:MAG: general secretion pathway protein J [Cyclobacteriaceae bacterium]|jgi:general secretion pathway protein J